MSKLKLTKASHTTKTITITVPATFDGKTLVQPTDERFDEKDFHAIANYIVLLQSCGYYWAAKAVQVGWGKWALIGYNYDEKRISQNRISSFVADAQSHSNFPQFVKELLDGRTLIGLIEDPEVQCHHLEVEEVN